MQFVKANNSYIIRLEKGESIIEKLELLCQEENISTAFLSGLGALLSATLAFYNLEKKEYELKKLSETHEIVSLVGNITLVDGKPFVHSHCVLSNSKFECFGGHLKEGAVGATCEIHLTKLDTEIERKLDEEIGLKLLDCSA